VSEAAGDEFVEYLVERDLGEQLARDFDARMMATSWHSYPKLFAIGHRALAELLLDDVVVEEKLDGSQFSFGVFNGELKIRSKGVQMHVDAPEKMFNKAVETVRDLYHASKLHDGWTYRAEYLAKPKHNTLAYDRTPNGYLAVFDINPSEEFYLGHAAKSVEAQRLGLEVVPLIYSGRIDSIAQFRGMLDRVSFLGGPKIEGVVVKNYSRFGPDKKVLMGKFVSEAFKEIHQGEWRAANPTKADIITALVQTHRTPARWAKAVQHLRERGALTDSPRDIGALIKEAQNDIELECKADIIDALWKYAWPQIARGVIGGLPDWYKEELMKRQFEQPEEATSAEPVL
jgi:hypothetical protein